MPVRFGRAADTLLRAARNRTHDLRLQRPQGDQRGEPRARLAPRTDRRLREGDLGNGPLRSRPSRARLGPPRGGRLQRPVRQRRLHRDRARICAERQEVAPALHHDPQGGRRAARLAHPLRGHHPGRLHLPRDHPAQAARRHRRPLPRPRRGADERPAQGRPPRPAHPFLRQPPRPRHQRGHPGLDGRRRHPGRRGRGGHPLRRDSPSPRDSSWRGGRGERPGIPLGGGACRARRPQAAARGAHGRPPLVRHGRGRGGGDDPLGGEGRRDVPPRPQQGIRRGEGHPRRGGQRHGRHPGRRRRLARAPRRGVHDPSPRSCPRERGWSGSICRDA